MAGMEIGSVVKTALITAFTIAAALIWKDVIVDVISLLLPYAQEIHFRIIAAILATMIVIVAIYVTIKTEEEAEFVAHKIADKRKKKPAVAAPATTPAAEAKK